MAGRKDIEAGRAKVTLWADSSQLVRGLKQVQQQMQSLGSSVMRVGGLITGMGAAIVAPLAGAVAHFNSAGDVLDKMSARTGVAVGALAELGYAAGLGGAGIEAVEKSIKRMQKTIVDAGDGVIGSVEAFQHLGLNLDELRGMKPEDQFTAIADALGNIADPTERAGRAMEIFGKSGTDLIPMLGSMRAAREEARQLGLVPTEASTKMAAALTDAFSKVQQVVAATFYEVGAAIAPILLPAAEAVAKMTSSIIFWIRENGELFRTIAKVGAGLLAAGAIITAVGAVIFGLGSVVGAAATLITALGAVFAAIVSPIGLVVIAIGGAVAAFLTLTETGRATAAFISEAFAGMLAVVREALGVAVDALMAGDLEAAARALWAGLQIVWHENTQTLNQYWLGAKLFFLQTWQGATSTMAGFFIDAYALIRSGWAEAAAFIAQLWDSVMGGNQSVEIEQKRQDAQKQIEADRQGAKGVLDDEYQQEIDRLNSEYESGIAAKRQALEQARAELSAIKSEVAAKNAEKIEGGSEEAYRSGSLDVPTAPDTTAVTSKVFGTFSASAAAAMGQGQADKQVGLLQAIRNNAEKQLAEQQRMREQLKNQAAFA